MRNLNVMKLLRRKTSPFGRSDIDFLAEYDPAYAGLRNDIDMSCIDKLNTLMGQY